MEMKKHKLGDIGEVRMCKRILKEETNTVSGIPFFKIGTFGDVADVFISRKKFEEYKAKYSYPKKGDVLISAAGTIGRTVVFNGEEAYFQDSNIVWIENDETKVVNALLYYAYKNVKWKVSNGSTILRLYNDDLRRTEIIVPADISVQKKIASVLSTLDKRIENLRAQNRVLEQTAKTIYDYTFLQCAGRKTVYNKILNRNIPTNWEVKKLGEIVDFKNGINYDPSKPGDKKTKIVNVRNVSSSTYFVSETDLDDLFVDEKHAAKYYVSQDDILITRSGTPGAARMIAPSKEPVVYCGFIIKMTFEDKKMKNYLFFKMKELEFAIQKQSAGSILSNISQDILNNLEIATPDANTLNDFNAQIEPLLKKQQVNTKQIEALTTQRNTLLSLLMTGQVEV